MITLQAVIEVTALATESPAPWPVAARDPFSWLVLDGDCTDEEVGLFVATLASKIDVPAAAGRNAVVDALLAEELLIVAGGLLLRNTDTDANVAPGCCAGLEDWQDWAQVLAGASPWLGHDPGPEVEFLDDRLRVWQDGGPHRHRSRPSGAYIDVRRDALAALLTGVQHDLVSFLRVLREWAQRAGLGPRADALGEAIDRNFAISNFAISNFAISNFAISNFAVPTCEVSDLADFNIGISGSTG